MTPERNSNGWERSGMQELFWWIALCRHTIGIRDDREKCGVSSGKASLSEHVFQGFLVFVRAWVLIFDICVSAGSKNENPHVMFTFSEITGTLYTSWTVAFFHKEILLNNSVFPFLLLSTSRHDKKLQHS